MASTVSGRSEFAFATALPPSDIVKIAQNVLDSYREAAGLKLAEARQISPTEIVIELKFDSDSFAFAERMIDELASSISTALQFHTATVERGVTELASV